eukprot:366055-Chlamydomonas_euryale.AAC.9
MQPSIHLTAHPLVHPSLRDTECGQAHPSLSLHAPHKHAAAPSSHIRLPKCGCPHIRLPIHVAVRMCGCPYMWLSTHVAARMCSCPYMWLCSPEAAALTRAAHTCRHPQMWPSTHVAARMCGCPYMWPSTHVAAHTCARFSMVMVIRRGVPPVRRCRILASRTDRSSSRSVAPDFHTFMNAETSWLISSWPASCTRTYAATLGRETCTAGSHSPGRELTHQGERHGGRHVPQGRLAQGKTCHIIEGDVLLEGPLPKARRGCGVCMGPCNVGYCDHVTCTDGCRLAWKHCGLPAHRHFNLGPACVQYPPTHATDEQHVYLPPRPFMAHFAGVCACICLPTCMPASDAEWHSKPAHT